jgi:hypothetical protein
MRRHGRAALRAQLLKQVAQGSVSRQRTGLMFAASAMPV